MANRAQGSTMMGPGLKVALWQWLMRGKGLLFAKMGYRPLEVREKSEKSKNTRWDSNPNTYGFQSTL